MAPLLVKGYVFLIGLCVGSFLNVCIHRLPSGQSIAHPPSACPQCGSGIRWFDNIPVLSYLFLRGRCRHCKTSISPRYPVVELLTGFLALATWTRFGPHWTVAIYFIFMAALVAVTFIDIDHRIIPDSISLPGIPIGFAASFVLPQLYWKESLIGILVGGGILLAVAWGYSLLTGKEGMGGGDIKLLAMIGAFVGWKGVIFTIMTASFVGTLVGVMVILKARGSMKSAVPFGPFLAIGAIGYLFFGPEVIDWYLLRLAH